MAQPTTEIHILSSVLHYGQALFEGLKVFSRADGSVAMYQPYMGNVERMARGCARLGMPQVDEAIFNGAIERVVRENLEFVPPYGSGGALYIRPFMYGCGAQLGLGAAPEYKFTVAVNPVGDYYSGGLAALDGLVMTEYDRAAARGTGAVKAGGNYAADVLPSAEAKEAGYPIALYLDSVEHKYVEEFSTSNFIAISKDGNYVTPASESILQSVTNMSLRQIARDLGMGVEERAVEWAEVGAFEEVAACGTAVVLTPIKSLTRADEIVEFGGFEQFQGLYDRVRVRSSKPRPFGRRCALAGEKAFVLVREDGSNAPNQLGSNRQKMGQKGQKNRAAAEPFCCLPGVRPSKRESTRTGTAGQSRSPDRWTVSTHVPPSLSSQHAFRKSIHSCPCTCSCARASAALDSAARLRTSLALPRLAAAPPSSRAESRRPTACPAWLSSLHKPCAAWASVSASKNVNARPAPTPATPSC